jgi:UDP-GlcNAc:undecaprenyl-phosphate GlcNAc-1-phosphate transferase
MNNILLLSIITLCATILNLIIIPFLIKLSHKKSWYDVTNDRKIHSGNIPRIGGIGIFISFIIAVFIFLIFCKYTNIKLNTISKYRYLVLSTGFLIITFIGIADDFFNIPAWPKFLLQTSAALIITLGGFNFDYIYVPFLKWNLQIGYFSHIITAFWIISVCNAVNLIDGMDGLAGGIGFIASLFYGIIFLTTKNYTAAGFSFALLGAILGFLIFNFPPAKIFMGDSGSLFIGFTLSVIPLIYNQEQISSMVFFMPVIVLIIPLIDMIAAILRRKKRNLPIASPDKEHIHHKLMAFGLSQKKILFVIYFFSIFAGLLGLLYTYLKSNIKETGFIIFLLTWLIYTILFTVLHYKNQTRKKNKT